MGFSVQIFTQGKVSFSMYKNFHRAAREELRRSLDLLSLRRRNLRCLLKILYRNAAAPLRHKENNPAAAAASETVRRDKLVSECVCMCVRASERAG